MTKHSCGSVSFHKLDSIFKIKTFSNVEMFSNNIKRCNTLESFRCFRERTHASFFFSLLHIVNSTLNNGMMQLFTPLIIGEDDASRVTVVAL